MHAVDSPSDIPAQQLRELQDIVGPDWVKTSADDLNNYGRDWTRQFTVDPLAAVLPRSVDQVVALVQWARQHRIAVVPSGGRTGLSGGAVAGRRELIIAFDRMNEILDYSEADRQVT